MRCTPAALQRVHRTGHRQEGLAGAGRPDAEGDVVAEHVGAGLFKRAQVAAPGWACGLAGRLRRVCRRCTVLPLLLATSAGGHLLHGAGRGDLPWSVGLLLLVLGGAQLGSLGRRKVQLENRLRQTDVQMQERINELDRHHQLLADQRLEQVTERERKRIAGDLHDDLGAKLLTIVHTSDNERISTLAREALEEMRLSVRGLTGRPVQLLDAIGDWRAEVVSRLTQSNIEAEWLSLAEEVSHTLPARAYVQTTRVLREAVSNVIKHSGATRCVVRCQLADGDFQLIIQDNGRGVPTEKDGRLDRGHGMASMKSRAKQMQGQCLVESGPGWGTLIRLTIPL
jgi:two-component system sensor histidine kinase UhpB